jgi:hypothetical protein
MVRWILHEVWEKINIPATYRGIKALGKKHGKRFFWVALIWELVEDILFPFLSWLFGVPGLIPVFLVLHFEPIVYPVFFWGFRMWDRYQGKEPWEPDRSAQSTYWRSTVKVALFQIVAMGWLSVLCYNNLAAKVLVVFCVLMSLFGFIHERIWHDTNYGIDAHDMVSSKRTYAKTGTYTLVSVMVFFPLLHAFKVQHAWFTMLLTQLATFCLYFILETMWSKSLWGVSATTKD